MIQQNISKITKQICAPQSCCENMQNIAEQFQSKNSELNLDKSEFKICSTAFNPAF